MEHLFISLILSFILAFLAFYKKAMTKPALILSFVFSCLITYYGGYCSFLILASTFIVITLASKIKPKKRNEINNKRIEKSKQKDIFQIIANVGLGTLVIVIYALTSNPLFLVVYASIMSESLADSLASDIGVLSKKEPINILTLKKGTPGLSGNISTLGLISSLLGTIIISLIYFIFNHSIIHFIIIIISGFLGALFDSFLGAIIQVKYKCPKCHEITEKTHHCNQKATYYKGIKTFNNDLVNFLSNAFSGLISFLLLTI